MWYIYGFNFNFFMLTTVSLVRKSDPLPEDMRDPKLVAHCFIQSLKTSYFCGTSGFSALDIGHNKCAI